MCVFYLNSAVKKTLGSSLARCKAAELRVNSACTVRYTCTQDCTCFLLENCLCSVAYASALDSHSIITAQLQRDIDAVVKWCNDWGMQLNFGKCRVMHCGRRNQSFRYSFNTTEASHYLEVTTREPDLGVIITSDMKWHEQVTSAASKASQMLGRLRKSFRTRDESVWKKLISTYVRPNVEFAVSVWNPYLRGDIKVLERVMRRATRVPGRLRDLEYGERCERLGFTSLEERRRRGDLIQQFKIAKGIELVKFERPALVSAPRGSKRAQLRREMVRSCNQRHNFFSNRIVNMWNELDDSIIEATSINEFKKRLDEATA